MERNHTHSLLVNTYFCNLNYTQRRKYLVQLSFDMLKSSKRLLGSKGPTLFPILESKNIILTWTCEKIAKQHFLFIVHEWSACHVHYGTKLACQMSCVLVKLIALQMKNMNEEVSLRASDTHMAKMCGVSHPYNTAWKRSILAGLWMNCTSHRKIILAILPSWVPLSCMWLKTLNPSQRADSNE